jgi:hypothetical protein
MFIRKPDCSTGSKAMRFLCDVTATLCPRRVVGSLHVSHWRIAIAAVIDAILTDYPLELASLLREKGP